MSVALRKVDGIASVNVTLKRGVAHITLEPGNSVSLPQLRRIIKDAGYTSGEAAVTVRGNLTRRTGGLLLEVTGTATTLQVVADPNSSDVVAALERSFHGPGTRAELSGTVPVLRRDGSGQDTLRLQSFTIDP